MNISRRMQPYTSNKEGMFIKTGENYRIYPIIANICIILEMTVIYFDLNENTIECHLFIEKFFFLFIVTDASPVQSVIELGALFFIRAI